MKSWAEWERPSPNPRGGSPDHSEAEGHLILLEEEAGPVHTAQEGHLEAISMAHLTAHSSLTTLTRERKPREGWEGLCRIPQRENQIYPPLGFPYMHCFGFFFPVLQGDVVL